MARGGKAGKRKAPGELPKWYGLVRHRAEAAAAVEKDELIESLLEENAALKAENAALKAELRPLKAAARSRYRRQITSGTLVARVSNGATRHVRGDARKQLQARSMVLEHITGDDVVGQMLWSVSQDPALLTTLVLAVPTSVLSKSDCVFVLRPSAEEVVDFMTDMDMSQKDYNTVLQMRWMKDVLPGRRKMDAVRVTRQAETIPMLSVVDGAMVKDPWAMLCADVRALGIRTVGEVAAAAADEQLLAGVAVVVDLTGEDD
jgi:hypothetical protein